MKINTEKLLASVQRYNTIGKYGILICFVLAIATAIMKMTAVSEFFANLIFYYAGIWLVAYFSLREAKEDEPKDKDASIEA